MKSLINLKDFVHAQICYQFFITPIPFLEKKYRDFAQRACEYFVKERTEILHFQNPRHYVLHHFQPDNNDAPKILIAHGWMSRAAYMARLTDTLRKQGFDIYVLDFPAHGEAKGRQLVWNEAVMILRQVLNDLGPFHGAIGHSFGGSMLLNALNLGRQFPEWRLHHEPEKVVLLAAPTRMRTPVKRVAKKLKLSPKAYLFLRDVFREHIVDINRLNFRNFTQKAQIPFLCIHGKDDITVPIKESTIFCDNYSYASLVLFAGINHVNILMDERVDETVCSFLRLDDGVYIS